MKNTVKILLIAILSMALLVGCSGKKNGADGQQQMVQEVAEENIVVTFEDAKKNVESLVTMANYNASENENGSANYSYKSDLFSDYDLDYVVTLDSSTRMSLPGNFPILRSLGWELKSEGLYLNPGASTNAVCEKDGKEVMMYLHNSTEEKTHCANCSVPRIKFELYSKEDGYAEALSTAPSFKLGNNIDNNTDLKGLISAIGEPSNISISKDGDNCADITFLYQNAETNMDYLKFVISPDGKKIVSVDYSVEN